MRNAFPPFPLSFRPSIVQGSLGVPCTGSTVGTTVTSYGEPLEADGDTETQGGHVCVVDSYLFQDLSQMLPCSLLLARI